MATARIIRLEVDVIGNGLHSVSSPDLEGLYTATETEDRIGAVSAEAAQGLLRARGENVDVYEATGSETGLALVAVPAAS